ncbi:TPA: hypothetical protein ACRRG3_005077 [Klebsiella pneumoniae]|uniref:hypothetical protein n=1 Tax=Klebsiella TaxID=570 RepID=UPI002011485A|nr:MULTISPECIES: hypothetical protein [Klebsiella]EKX0528945.1 hypothetical protein [Klebsiella pneumoniae]MCL1508123.1 hypothetical protein [Klebsiella quasipneumoniae]USP83032.1 hypothetical protein MKM89_13635 [Klebsiella quasipneumoniae]WPI28289.1 hypothetical protein R8550_09880 [Klebsiella oxytoca]
MTTNITELAQRNELLIANGQQTADLLRHLADNEIDSDYFAVVSECESYGKETDAELSITEFALRAAGYVDALVEALEKAQTINAAAEKLVRCKGRYHSEQNYRALAALFGVKTPDLPPLDSESSAVTVKLTDINEYLAEVHDKTLNRAFRLLAEGVRAGDVAAMRAAGIKVEAE